MFKVGDFVAVLNEPIKGEVMGVIGKSIQIRTSDDFILSYEARFLVKHQSDWLENTVIGNKELSSKKPKKKNIFEIEVDLHCKDKSVPSDKILTEQLLLFKTKLNAGISKKIPEMIFVHGFGEGILKAEIVKILHRHQIKFSDAPYTKYAMGAAISVDLRGVSKKIG